MKKILLLGILLILLVVSACQGTPAVTDPASPNDHTASVAVSSAAAHDLTRETEAAVSSAENPPIPSDAVSAPETAPVAAATAAPITVEDLLLRDYVQVYETYCGTEFASPTVLSPKTMRRYLFGWLSENGLLESYAVYNGAKVDYYSVPLREALEFYGLFWDDGTWEKLRNSPISAMKDALRFDAAELSQLSENAPEVRLKQYEVHADGSYTLIVERFHNGREWYPAKYQFAPITISSAVPPMLEGKTAVGGVLYRFVSMENLPFPVKENDGEVITIRTVKELLDLAEQVNGGDAAYQNNVYRLGGDLDLQDVSLAPIGAYVSSDPRDPAPQGFCTSFDGRGFTISNLVISDNQGSTGLFAYVGANGFVTNVTLKNCAISSAKPPLGENYPTGGIAGELVGGAVSRCTVMGEVTGTRDVGGVVGLTDGGANVQESRSDALVTGNRRVGGIVGHAISGTLIECTAIGKIEGVEADQSEPGELGGFVGCNKGATIDRGIVSVRVRANTTLGSVGSFAGKSTGTLLGCFYNTDLSKSETPIGASESGVSRTVYPRELIGMTQKELEDMIAFG